MQEKHRKMLALIHTNKHFVLDVQCLDKKFIVHPVETDNKRHELMLKHSIVVVLTATRQIRIGRMLDNFQQTKANKLMTVREGQTLPSKIPFHALPSQMIAVLFELKNN